jgi:hypothetical protein
MNWTEAHILGDIEAKDAEVSDDLVKRLRDPAFGTETSERLLMVAAADRIEALTAELATCEKYRDAYAECDRIGTQAVRDLEAKLAKAVEALREIAGECGCSTARVTLAEIEGEKG